ncbi:unnamed protein product [Dovyalis caffra]|uniref:Uncharacterized protein n=1 Tax=Dovyalis caffra TaxID=77055 RepID=A0AAV1S5P0_9ROSI|nr:unnamed protein product [Dovyalis caffra]
MDRSEFEIGIVRAIFVQDKYKSEVMALLVRLNSYYKVTSGPKEKFFCPYQNFRCIRCPTLIEISFRKFFLTVIDPVS